MPNRDRTGPFGMGMMSGRAMGPCSGMARGGFGFGRGAGYGYGCGFAGRRGFWGQPITDSKEVLEEQKAFFKGRLEEIDKQLEEL